MFTGIVKTRGRLEGREPRPGGARLAVRPDRPLERLEVGESIAVNGACLTVEAGAKADRLLFFCSDETLKRTTLGCLTAGDSVNLERALAANDRLGGHLVSGHVDSVGHVSSFEQAGEAWRLVVGYPPELAPMIAAKGSIAVDGISLTVVEVEDDWFSVAVIPTTVAETTLADACAGRPVNLEVDVLARYVLRAAEVLGGKAGGVTPDLLSRAGFFDKQRS